MEKVSSVTGQPSHDLSDDLKPLLNIIQLSGHFLPDYDKEKDRNQVALHTFYSLFNILLCVLQFIFLIINLVMELGETSAIVSNTLTVLFFLPSITKVAYFAVKRKQFYRTINIWTVIYTHPMFIESDAKHRQMGYQEMKLLLRYVLIATGVIVFLWAFQPFLFPGTRPIAITLDNSTIGNFSLVESSIITPLVEVNTLMFSSWYPWDPNASAFSYFMTYLYQVYFLLMSICQVNLMDALFSSLLIYACEQLKHLKEGMHGLMNLSAGLGENRENNGIYPSEVLSAVMDNIPEDGNRLRSAFRRGNQVFPNDGREVISIPRYIISARTELLGYRTPASAIETDQQMQLNPDILRQDMVVRAAIKYWVERHKHILKFVEAVGDTYGTALLLHMLTSTVTLTLLSYEATKISGFNLTAFVVVGYLCYTLAQVFLFCVFGNRLIEESISVMHSAYSCSWYDSSEEAKTFVQIVCQQCQRPMSVSGAKFFTVSLDLFASVLGAVVTYFMVLIQLN